MARKLGFTPVRTINGTERGETLYATAPFGDALFGLGGSDRLNGSSGWDGLFGGNGDDRLFGNGGDDWLNGGSGNDVINGGTGIDTVDYSDAAGGITLNLSSTRGQRTSGSGTDTVTNVENVNGSSFNDRLTGNGLANQLDGNGGNDQLFGMVGNDILTGGLGDDLIDGGIGIDMANYADAVAGVAVNLSLAGAQDTVGSGIDTLVSIENIDGSGFNDALTGNAGANTLNGGEGADQLVGGDGNDVLIGGAGTDIYNGGAGNDILIAGPEAGYGDMELMTGGAGADTFIFSWVDPALINSRNVFDFSSTEGDKIDISGVLGDLQASYIGNSAFTGTAGEVRVQTGFGTVVYIDMNGDSISDYSIVVGSGGFGGGTILTVDDFIF